jgi:transcriptional regulator NrdR family protein
MSGIICPTCGSPANRVIESRGTPTNVRRRRVCRGCKGRFTTREILDGAASQVSARRLARIASLLDSSARRVRDALGEVTAHEDARRAPDRSAVQP